jgi:ParB-like chromosome segregation protein Spo0J
MAKKAKTPDNIEPPVSEPELRDNLSRGESPPDVGGDTPPNVTVGFFGDAREQAAEPPPPPAPEADAPAQKRRGRPPKAEAEKAPDADKPKGRGGRPPKNKAPDAEKTAPAQPEAVAAQEEPPAPAEQPAQPKEAPRPNGTDQIVYLSLSELQPFKNHPFGVRDDAEMRALVESVKAGGVNQPALVRPREDGGYEIIAGHRRQKASEMAGFVDMPCIVREMTDDEAVLAMTDDNLRQRSEILPSEKAVSLKMQVEAIKHQGARDATGKDAEDVGKRSIQIVGDRNGINAKQVQRYIRLTMLVPDLQKAMDEKRLGFTPAVEISFIKPRNQNFIAVAIEGQQSAPSLAQAQRMRELDKDGQLNGDVIDGILGEQKKEEIKVILTGKELETYFGKDKTPQQMKEQIVRLLDEWKEKQPPELAAPTKNAER